jgi:hypothetical protein
MELNQEPLPDHILIPLKEAREEWLWRDAPVNPRALSYIAMNEALDNLQSHLRAVEEFERVFNRGEYDV